MRCGQPAQRAWQALPLLISVDLAEKPLSTPAEEERCCPHHLAKKQFLNAFLVCTRLQLTPYPSALVHSSGFQAGFHLLSVNAMQHPPEVLCGIPAQLHPRLEECWLARHRQPSVDKDLLIPGSARLVPLKPLGFFG